VPDILYTAIFSGGQRGWEESYVGFRSSGDLAQANALIQPFWQARAPLSGTGVLIQATKASAITDKGDSFLTRANYGGSANEACNDFETSVNFRMSTANGRYQARHFLRGCWDVVFNDARFNDNQVAWVTLFNSFRAQIVQRQLGWMGLTDPQLSSFVANYLAANTGIITFTLSEPLFVGLPLNKKVKVRFSGMGQRSPLNRELVVIPKSDTTCISAAPIAAAPYQGTGFCFLTTKERRTAETVELERIGRRPAGAPLLQPVGRGRNRPRW
jgi:hypothetical protein